LILAQYALNKLPMQGGQGFGRSNPWRLKHWCRLPKRIRWTFSTASRILFWQIACDRMFDYLADAVLPHQQKE